MSRVSEKNIKVWEFTIYTAFKIWIVVFWVVTPRPVVCGYQIFGKTIISLFRVERYTTITFATQKSTIHA
jgi:hypothetical protein